MLLLNKDMNNSNLSKNKYYEITLNIKHAKSKTYVKKPTLSYDETSHQCIC